MRYYTSIYYNVIFLTGFVSNAVFLQYCVMEHFFDCDYKVLCCSMSELAPNIKSLSEDQLEKLRQLPSFRRYVDKLPQKEKAPLLVDDDHFRVSKLVLERGCLLKCWQNSTRVCIVKTQKTAIFELT